MLAFLVTASIALAFVYAIGFRHGTRCSRVEVETPHTWTDRELVNAVELQFEREAEATHAWVERMRALGPDAAAPVVDLAEVRRRRAP